VPRSSFPNSSPSLGVSHFLPIPINRSSRIEAIHAWRHVTRNYMDVSFGRKSRDASADLAWTTDSNEERAHTWGKEGKKNERLAQRTEKDGGCGWHGWANIERSFRRSGARNPWFTAREDRLLFPGRSPLLAATAMLIRVRAARACINTSGIRAHRVLCTYVRATRDFFLSVGSRE